MGLPRFVAAALALSAAQAAPDSNKFKEALARLAAEAAQHRQARPQQDEVSRWKDEYECSILGSIPLPDCPEKACDSIKSITNSLLGGLALAQPDVDISCEPFHYDICLAPFFQNPIVAGAAGDVTAEAVCSGKTKCLILGMVEVPDCPAAECAAIQSFSVALTSGGAAAADDVHTACSEPQRCMLPFFANPVVQGVLPTTAEAFCQSAGSYGCNVLGLVPLDVCPKKQCQAIEGLAAGFMAGAPATFEQVTVMCTERERCAEPFWSNPLVKGLTGGTPTNYWCGTPAPSAVEIERPNCTAANITPTENFRVGDGQPAGKCSAVQEETGLQCCDDPYGELKAVDTTCELLAPDVSANCYEDLNSRLWDIFKCPVDVVNGSNPRKVRQICPRRCRDLRVPGCECPNSYDRGCPKLQCLAPDEDIFDWDVKCSDCEVDGANLKCTEPGQAFKTVLQIVLFVVLGLEVIGVTVYVVRHRVQTQVHLQQQRRVSTVIQEIEHKLVGLTGGDGAARVVERVWSCFERYRLFFERWCFRFGWFLSGHRAVFLSAIILIMALFSACGLPQAEIDTSPTSVDWAPSGGRLERQLRYWNKWKSPSAAFTWFFMMVGPDDKSESALQQKYLHASWRLMHELRDIMVQAPRADGNGTMDVGFEDFCLRIPENPTFDAIYPGEKPCISPGPLDCFFEGTWQIENTTAHRWPEEVTEATRNLEIGVGILNNIFGATGSVVDNYRDRPSYTELTSDQIAARLSEWPLRHGGCYNWATGYTLQRLYAVGGIIEDPPVECPPDKTVNRTIKHAQMISHLVMQTSIDQSQASRSRLTAIQQNDILEARRTWEDLVEQHLERADGDEVNYPGTRVSVIFSTFQADVIKELSSAQFITIIAGYCTMSIVIAWEIHCKNPVENLAPIAALYFFFIMAMSTGAAFGVIAVAGLKYNHLMLQVLPYLSIGLGVDDMFLLLHYFRSVPDKWRNNQDICGELMHGGGRSVTLTSLTNILTFFGGTLVPIPALQNYLLLGGLIVLFNYISSVICLPLMLTFWVDRYREKTKELAEEAKLNKDTRVTGPQGWVENTWAPFISRRPVQVVFVAVWLIVVVFCSISLAVIAPITVDFDLVDLTPRGTFLAQSVGDFQDLFYNQLYMHGWMVELGDGSGKPPYGAGLDITDPDVQEKLQRTAFHLPQLDYVVRENPDHWLFRLYEYIEKVAPERLHKSDYHTGKPHRTKCSADCWLANGGSKTKPWIESPENLRAFDICNATGDCGIYLAGYSWWTDQETFWKLFHDWRHPIDGGIDSLAAAASGAGSWGYTMGSERWNPIPGCEDPGCNDTNYMVLTMTTYNADTRCFREPGEWEDHVNAIRGAVSSKGLGEYAYPYPTGVYFDVELYDVTLVFFWQTLAIAVCGVFVAAIIVPLSVKGAFLIALSGLASTIELTGFLMLAGVSFTTTIAVSIIMAIGLAVDPAVHCVSGYEHSMTAGRDARLFNACKYSTIPINKSAISTIISLVWMASSPYPYVLKYSFLPLILTIVISLVHGVLLMPALLGLLGADTGLEPIAEDGAGTPVPAEGPAEDSGDKAAVQMLQVMPLGGAASPTPDGKDVVSRDVDRQKQEQDIQKKIEEKKKQGR
eukprot:TRINITY_DN8045_c4_g1_i1.p1 TRINITY_DN8045_c4_g1~~TRINITY_DN8045_c4_g1_i1.p1  ORF type:complete len:1649 (+),score=541.03 TRINITY_DN8045_c4_g1_i1:95-4948(+)